MLSDICIAEEVGRGRLSIIPWVPSHVSPASLDLQLGNEFIRPKFRRRLIDVESKTDVEDAFERVIDDRPIIDSGQMLLAVTVEEIGLPANLVGILHGRSSLGRLGLCVHVTAGLIDPGFRGRITLELVNHSPYAIRLKAGMRIAQIAFHRLEKPAAKPYTGKYQGDRSVQMSLLAEDWS